MGFPDSDRDLWRVIDELLGVIDDLLIQKPAAQVKAMKTKLVLKLGDGNFRQGFPDSVIEVRPNGGNGQELNCDLPPAPELPPTYQKWQKEYRGLVGVEARGFKKTYQTQFSVVDCEKYYQELSTAINNWLNTLPIIYKLKEILNSKESADNQTILLEVNTQQVNDPKIKYLLHQLHFESWDLFNSYQVNNFLSLHQVNSDSPETPTEVKSKSVKILGILGDDTGIDLTKDKELIENLRLRRAKPVFLPDADGKKLTRADFKKLWQSRWDILIFTGHSDTRLDGETGVIHLNPNEFLDFQEIKETLKEAKRLGLKLAIFNSCDGLGLAEQLKELGITVIVWREPVPNKTASLLLNYFLDEFTNKAGESIYRAMWAARKRLEELHPELKKELAGVTGLPVAIHNGTQEPPTWNQLRGRSGGRIGGADWSEKRELSRQESNCLKFLENVKYEVDNRLSASLHRQLSALINLNKESQPQQVKRPWDLDVLIGSDEERLPPYTDISEVFDERVKGKLLILGTAGAGKTTTMLELARELIDRALTDINQPMPGLFNLSTWRDDKQSMIDWLVEQLKTKGVRKDIARQWLANEKILPMLDGLDELELERQESCVEAINTWLEGEYSPPALLVCSRIEEYEKYESQLSLNGAVRLLPLSDEQIRGYLKQFDRADLWEAIANDERWLTLVRVPLWLRITIVADVSASKMQQLTSAEERLTYLLDEYAVKMLNRKIKSQAYVEEKEAPKSKQVKFWLIWLAEQMERESQTEFFIDNMQPDFLLGVWQKRMYFTSIFIITGMLAGIAGLMFGLLLGDIFLGLLWSIVGFPIGGLVCTMVTMKVRVRIHPSATIKYSIAAFLYRLRLAMTSTILISVIGLLAFEMSVRFFYGINIASSLGEILIESLRSGLLYGILLGTALVMINKIIITAPDIEKRTSSSQNIMKSFKDVGIFGASLTFVGCLVGWLNNLPVLGIIASGIIGGIFGGLAGGGGASIQHFSLRLVLYFTGKTPWNYARFLDYATERRLLQRVGGGYRFLHKYLQEHFAYNLPK